jgi:hypothetical protein
MIEECDCAHCGLADARALFAFKKGESYGQRSISFDRRHCRSARRPIHLDGLVRADASKPSA